MCLGHYFHGEEEAGIPGFSTTNQKSYAPSLQLQPVHLKGEFRFDLEKKTLVADVTHTIRVNQPSRSIVFNGVGFFNVKVVALDQFDGETLSWSYDGKLISITWDKDLSRSHTYRVKISYLVDHPFTGLEFSYPDEAYPNRPIFAGTDHETERARHWLASMDYPTVRTPLDLHITSKEEYTIVTNGLLQSEKPNGDGTKTAHWKLEQPCPSYLVCIGIGNLVSIKDGEHNGIPFEYFAVKGTNTQDLITSFGHTGEIMKFLENLLKQPFPYPKYYQIVLPKIGGAMENISLTTWDPSFFCDKKYAQEMFIITDQINCHEMSHSYFGDAIGIRYFEHAWLKESWASYCQYLWMEHKRGSADFEYCLFNAARGYVTECQTYVRPIVCRTYDSSWHLFDGHLYPGGAWRLHMLRMKLGNDVFWAAVQDYVKTYFHQTAETDDFRKILEKHSGMNLTQFFDQWLYGRGFPQLKGKHNYDEKTKEISVEFQQTQVDAKLQVELFNFQLEVEVIDEENKSHVQVLNFNNSDKASSTFKLNSAPVEIRVDPRQLVLFTMDFNPGEEFLGKTLKNSPNIAQRIRSAIKLADIGTRSAVAKISEALVNEKFYAVRGEAITALAKVNTSYAIQAIVEVFERETEPMALSLMTAAMKSIKHAAVEKSLRNFVENPRGGYKSLANALEGLGKYGRKYEEILKKSAEDMGWLGIVRGGAYRGLSQFRNSEIHEFLKQRVAPGEMEESRPAAIAAFAENASWLEERYKRDAVEVLCNILAEDDYGVPRVLLAAIHALAVLQDENSISKLKAVKVKLDPQDHIEVDQAIKSINSKGEPLKKEIQTLREKIEKLELKLEESPKKE